MIEVTLDQLAAELGIGPARDPPEELHSEGGLPGRDGDRRRLRLRATTTRRSTGCSSTSTSTRSGASRRSCARSGVYRGIGLSTYTEICGLAPSRITGPGGVGVQAGGWESAMVRVHNTGAVTAYTGTSPHGQGHETAFAQIVADRLGVDPAVVEVIHGDTGTGPEGRNTYGSRSLAVGGEALREVRHQGRRQGEGDRRPSARGGAGGHRGPRRQVLGQGLARQGHDARRGGRRRVHLRAFRTGWSPGSRRRRSTTRRTSCSRSARTRASSTSMPRPARSKVVRYVAVDDCGTAINPLLIDGQVHGGIVHAIGQALYERVHYDEDGQLVTGTFVDYALPTAAELPSFETRPHRDAVAGQLARRQGRRRGGHDRREPGGHERRDRRAAAARRDLHQHAAQPDAGVGGDPRPLRREVCPHDSRRIRLHRPGHAGRGDQGARRRRRGRQAARRRSLADPADEAAAGGAVAARRPAQGARACTGSSARTAPGGSAR